MVFNYDAAYTEEDVVAMTEEAVKWWKTKAEDVPELDAGRLLKTVRGMLEAWNEAKVGVDVNFQALLAVLRACDESWFNKGQLEDLTAWLDVVAEAQGPDDWQRGFQDDAAIRDAVTKGLQAEAVPTIDRDAQGISVAYTQGDYGTGPHDGTLIITGTSLSIYSPTTPDTCTQYEGQLPQDASELLDCLEDDSWIDVAR